MQAAQQANTALTQAIMNSMLPPIPRRQQLTSWRRGSSECVEDATDALAAAKQQSAPDDVGLKRSGL